MKHNKRMLFLRLIAIVLCLVFIMSKFITKTLAKYTSSDFGSDSARVATFFIGDTNEEETINFSLSDMSVGETKELEFAIVNTVNDKLTEVAYNYEFVVSTLNNLPLSIKVELVSSNGGTPATITNLTGKDGTMNCNGSITHTYKISITWDKNETDYEYTQEVDLLIISYTCTQID